MLQLPFDFPRPLGPWVSSWPWTSLPPAPLGTPGFRQSARAPQRLQRHGRRLSGRGGGPICWVWVQVSRATFPILSRDLPPKKKQQQGKQQNGESTPRKLVFGGSRLCCFFSHLVEAARNWGSKLFLFSAGSPVLSRLESKQPGRQERCCPAWRASTSEEPGEG